MKVPRAVPCGYVFPLMTRPLHALRQHIWVVLPGAWVVPFCHCGTFGSCDAGCLSHGASGSPVLAVAGGKVDAG